MTTPLGIWHQPRMIAPQPAHQTYRRQRVLVVEDDTDIAILIADMLSERGYDVTQTADGRAMEQRLRQDSIDLVILDLMLPGEDGLSLCRRLRTRYGIPILMLTAIGAEADRIVGLESGADDYMVKPFAPRELLARVRALLRRTGGHGDPAPQYEIIAYRFGGWELHLMRLSLTAPDGSLVPLTSAEFSLLAALCAHPGEVVSRETLLTRGENAHPAAFDRSVDTLIGRLRRKLAARPIDIIPAALDPSALPAATGGFAPCTPTGAPVGVQGVKPPPAGGNAEGPKAGAIGDGGEIIRTIRNAGYLLVPPVEARVRGET